MPPMMNPDSDVTDELVRRIASSTGLGESTARRVLQDVVAHFSETPQDYVNRRHGELVRAGWKNADIYERLSRELTARPFAGPAFSPRQIRRMIYG